MPIHKDNFFSLTKSEWRATLLLLIIVLILVGTRVIQQYYYTRANETPTEEYNNFQSTLNEFNRSLQKVETPQTTKPKRQKKVKEELPPKQLTPVPREE